MSAPIPVQGEAFFRFWAPGLQGPTERNVVVSLTKGLVTAPEQMRRLDFENDCSTHIERWLNEIKADRKILASGLEAVAYTSAVLTEAFGR